MGEAKRRWTGKRLTAVLISVGASLAQLGSASEPGGPAVAAGAAHSTEGSTGYIIGGFARQKGDADIGKFTLTLRKAADGRWLIMSDMDNGNSRP